MDQHPRAPSPAATETLWGHGHLPLLAGARSKDSVEYVLQALWRTRRTGLDAADRAVVRDILQIPSDTDLDPLLVCLRILIRRCVHGNVEKEEISKLFPEEVPLELQRLLALLLQKFQSEWREDASKDQLQNGIESAKSSSKLGEGQVKLHLTKDSLSKMLKEMYSIKDEGSNPGNITGPEENAGSIIVLHEEAA